MSFEFSRQYFDRKQTNVSFFSGQNNNFFRMKKQTLMNEMEKIIKGRPLFKSGAVTDYSLFERKLLFFKQEFFRENVTQMSASAISTGFQWKTF